VLAGYSHTPYECWLMCLAENGDALWSRTFPLHSRHLAAGGMMRLSAISECRDGGVVIAGDAQSDSSWYDGARSVGWILKTGNNAEQQWVRFYKGEQWNSLFGIKVLPDGGYLAEGEQIRYEGKNTSKTGWLLIVDAQGQIVRENKMALGERSMIHSLYETPDRRLVLGVKDDYREAGDYFLVSVSANGDSLGSRKFVTTTEDIFAVAKCPTDDGYLFTGQFLPDSARAGVPRKSYGYFMKTGASGEKQWAWSYGSGKLERLSSIVPVGGGYILVGFTESDHTASCMTATKR
jgi:hypothetical protein